ncbi:histidine decarboxylase [Oceaniferula spumae]|uniref:Histidine decarboxylase n=1 Tax=Oceaniferula spumae TaxID=2979115 RepID=A0AAT9FKC2_9BACT
MISEQTRTMLNSGVDSSRLDHDYQRLKGLARSSLGYPCNQAFDYRELLPFLEMPLNNVGDPFQESSYALNTLDYEREVIDIFADLAQLPHGQHWGYVTNGGTEGNMYGLYLARELFRHGMVYFSEQTHYSVAKILRLQHTPSIMIKAQENGEMDYDDLRESIRINRHLPPIIFANIGTTMTGAIDDLTKIHNILDELAIREHYVHADAAMHGLALAFIDNPPAWDFAAGIDSLSISGHKWLGSPIPCGIALARSSHVKRISRAVEYVGVNDTTISGSRSAYAPLMIWYGLRKHGEDGLKKMIKDSILLAQYTVEAFQKKGIQAWRNQNSPIVVFPKPNNEVIRRWSLAVDRNIGHIVCLPHIEKSTIDTFIEDYLTGSPEPH